MIMRELHEQLRNILLLSQAIGGEVPCQGAVPELPRSRASILLHAADWAWIRERYRGEPTGSSRMHNSVEFR